MSPSFEQVLETSQISCVIASALHEAFCTQQTGNNVDRLIAENLIRGSSSFFIVPADVEEDSVAKREAFQNMLVREGVLERITKALAKLYESEIWKSEDDNQELLQRYVGETMFTK